MIRVEITRKNIEAISKITASFDGVDFDAESNEKIAGSLFDIIQPDDLQALLSILISIDKKRLGKAYKLLFDEKKPRKALPKETDTNYDKKSVLELFEKHSDEEIKKLHDFFELKKMYYDFYGSGSGRPLAPKSKGDIIQTFRNHIYSIKRARLFNV